MIRARVLALPLALLTGLVANSGDAQADKEAAKLHMARAKAALASEKYSEALSLYQEAYAAYPSPQFLFNQAQIQRKNLADCPAALASYRQFLAAAPFAEEALQKASVVARRHEKSLVLQCPLDKPDGPRPKVEKTSWHVDEPAAQPANPALGRDQSEQPARHWRQASSTGKLTSDAGFYDSYFGHNPLPAVLRVGFVTRQYVMGDIDVPMTGGLQGTLAMPIDFGSMPLRATLSLASSPMRYRGDKEGLAFMTPLSAGLESATDTSGFVLTGSVHLGLLGIFGLKEGNPMTAGGEGKAGAFAMEAGAQVGFEWPFTKEWALAAGLEASAASAPSDFASDIVFVNHYGLTLGLSKEL